MWMNIRCNQLSGVIVLRGREYLLGFTDLQEITHVHDRHSITTISQGISTTHLCQGQMCSLLATKTFLNAYKNSKTPVRGFGGTIPNL